MDAQDAPRIPCSLPRVERQPKLACRCAGRTGCAAGEPGLGHAAPADMRRQVNCACNRLHSTGTPRLYGATRSRNAPADLTIGDGSSAGLQMIGGWGGIRTHESLARLPDFKSGAFNRSATHPGRPRTFPATAPTGRAGGGKPLGDPYGACRRRTLRRAKTVDFRVGKAHVSTRGWTRRNARSLKPVWFLLV